MVYEILLLASGLLDSRSGLRIKGAEIVVFEIQVVVFDPRVRLQDFSSPVLNGSFLFKYYFSRLDFEVSMLGLLWN